eukprot:16629_1
MKRYAFSIWVLSALTLCMVSLLLRNANIVSIPYGLNTYSNTYVNTNTSHNTMNTTNCNPLVITGLRGTGIRHELLARGFNIQCTRREKKSIFRRKSWRNLKQGQTRFDKKCFKYNITNSNDNLFCNGGELICGDQQWQSTVADIDKKT